MSNNYKIITIEEAEDAKNVIAHLNPDFIKAIRIFKMLKINFRNPVEAFNNLKCPKNFLLNLPCLLMIKFSEVFFKEKVTTVPFKDVPMLYPPQALTILGERIFGKKH
jgi:hypothetical protein